MRKIEWILGACVLFLDQILGFFFQQVPNGESLWFKPSFGLFGLAFVGFFILRRFLHTSTGWILLFIGLLSNFILFIRFGRIIDYIPLFFWRTNLSDALICVGILLVGYTLLKKID